VSAERDGTWWRFAVDDNGIGIDAQDAERIFGMFQRLHTREHYPGTGIGLAIARKVVENHGGRIWAEPRPDGGTRMAFTLPAEEG
jgi:signal transduction histidine kinase